MSKFHKTWDYQIDFARNNGNLTQNVRKELIDAFEFFKEEFGNGFLKSCQLDHPFSQITSNKVSAEAHDLILIYQSLKKLKSTTINLKALSKDLLSLFFIGSKLRGLT